MRPVSPIPPPSSRSTLSSVQTSSEYRVKFSMPRKLTDQVTSLRRNHRDRGKQQAERRRPSSEKGTVPTRLSRYLHEGQRTARSFTTKCWLRYTRDCQGTYHHLLHPLRPTYIPVYHSIFSIFSNLLQPPPHPLCKPSPIFLSQTPKM